MSIVDVRALCDARTVIESADRYCNDIIVIRTMLTPSAYSGGARRRVDELNAKIREFITRERKAALEEIDKEIKLAIAKSVTVIVGDES